MRSFIWTNGPMILYVTYNMCWETISLNFVSEVTLFAKITKGVKGFPKIHYRLQKHQRHIQQSMGLVSEWQCSGRGTPCVLQTAPRLTGVQLRSSAQMLKDFRGHLEESFLFRIIIEWISTAFTSQTGPGQTVTYQRLLLCYYIGSVQAPSLLSRPCFLFHVFSCCFSHPHLCVPDRRALPLCPSVLGYPLWTAYCCPLTSASEHLLCYQRAHLFILQCFCAICKG